MKSKKSQVWVETAIYTLIGMTIIAIILTLALPQIEKVKDRETIKQTISVLNTLNSKISETKQSAGSIRIVQFRLAKGQMELDSNQETIIYRLGDTKLKLSEPGEEIEEGNLILKTTEKGSKFEITLKLNYSDSLNLTYKGEDKNEIFHSRANYKLQMENVGDNSPGENLHINFDVI